MRDSSDVQAHAYSVGCFANGLNLRSSLSLNIGCTLIPSWFQAFRGNLRDSSLPAAERAKGLFKTFPRASYRFLKAVCKGKIWGRIGDQSSSQSSKQRRFLAKDRASKRSEALQRPQRTITFFQRKAFFYQGHFVFV